MAVKFNESQGKAKKNANYYKYVDGENTLRLVGDLLPVYSYWVKGGDGKDHSLECLGFDRNSETFLNKEKDWVRHYFPEKKCSWSYMIQAIDVKNGKLVLVPLKKKLFEQIKVAAEDLGDPTDIEKGWDCVFKKVKTGPQAFNVEYTLQVLRCKHRPLTDDERALLVDMKQIDELVPRPTAEDQKKYLQEKVLTGGDSDDSDDSAEKEYDSSSTGSDSGNATASSLDKPSSDDDIPY